MKKKWTKEVTLREILETLYWKAYEHTHSSGEAINEAINELSIESNRTQSGVQIEGEGIPVFPIKCRNEWREEEPNG